VVARFVHTEEVTGSNPVSPTEEFGPFPLNPAEADLFCARSFCPPLVKESYYD
jgi:hypothetical protein